MRSILDIIREQKVSPIDISEAYRESLRQFYGDRNGMIQICGYYYDAADALESIDPVAFREGLSGEYDRLTDEGAIEIHGELYWEHDLENAIRDALGESDHAERLINQYGLF